MMIMSLLSTCLGFLDFTMCTTRGPPIQPTAPARIQRAIPHRFPKNTFVFIQNTDGDVFAAHLTDRCDRIIPPWVRIPSYRAHGTENVFVEMPNGDDLLADTRVNDLGLAIDINHGVPLDPRCFILYRKTLVLITSLVPYERYEEERPRVPRIIVRMPKTLDLYTGEFQRLYTQPPEWLKV